MDNELKRSVDYSRKRLQAIRNCEGHVADILWKSTQKIVTASKRYRGAGRLTNESALLSYAKNVTAEAEESINSYISAYSKASCKILGIDSETSNRFSSATSTERRHLKETLSISETLRKIL